MIRLIAIIATLALSSPALAQQQPKCGPAINVSMALKLRYGETVVDEEERPAKNAPDVLVTWQMWASSEGDRTWSLTGRINDVMCLFAEGTGYDGRTVSDMLVPRLEPEGTAL